MFRARFGVACTLIALGAIAGGIIGSFVADAILPEADIDYAYGIGVGKWLGLVALGAVVGGCTAGALAHFYKRRRSR
jgi:hypothetical protein